MPTDCLDFDAVTSAVKALLDPLEGVGIVEQRPGGVATWIKRPRPLQAFVELTVLSSSERGAGVGPQAFETPLIQSEWWMPWSYTNPNSQATWGPLIKRARDRLRSYPTLANAVAGIKSFGLPQLTTNDLQEFADGEKVVLCHHAIITITGDRYFSYTVSSTL